jgi:hypothetical protein
MLSQAIAASSPAATLGAIFSETVVWTGYHVRDWDPALNSQIGDTVDRVLIAAGTGAGSFALPNQCSLAVSIRKGSTGRRRWNRFYLPPMIVTATAGGDHVALSVCQALSDWLVAEQDALLANTIPFTMVRYSPAGSSFDPPDATFIGTRIDTQRRRANAEAEVRVQDDLTQP